MQEKSDEKEKKLKSNNGKDGVFLIRTKFKGVFLLYITLDHNHLLGVLVIKYLCFLCSKFLGQAVDIELKVVQQKWRILWPYLLIFWTKI